MAVEIGSLVVRGTFGQSGVPGAITQDVLDEQLAAIRISMIEQMRDMMEEADRRARER